MTSLRLLGRNERNFANVWRHNERSMTSPNAFAALQFETARLIPLSVCAKTYSRPQATR